MAKYKTANKRIELTEIAAEKLEVLDPVELVRRASLSVVEAFFAKLKEIKESSREITSFLNF